MTGEFCTVSTVRFPSPLAGEGRSRNASGVRGLRPLRIHRVLRAELAKSEADSVWRIYSFTSNTVPQPALPQPVPPVAVVPYRCLFSESRPDVG